MKNLEVNQEERPAQLMFMGAHAANEGVTFLAAEGLEHDVYPISADATTIRKGKSK